MAVTLVFRHNISAADDLRIKYRLSGDLFNICRFQAVTKATNDIIFDLQYAGDAALPSHTPDGLQRQLDAIFSAYSCAELVMNSKNRKSFTFHQIRRLPRLFFISRDQRGLTEQFTYLGSITPHVISLRRFNIVLTQRPLPSVGCPSAFSQTVTFPHAPVWTFTTPSAFRHSSMHASDWHRTVVTSEPSRLFTFGASNYPACTLVGQNTSCPDLPKSKHNMPRDDTPQKITEVTRACGKDALKQISPPPALQWTFLRSTFGGGSKEAF